MSASPEESPSPLTPSPSSRSISLDRVARALEAISEPSYLSRVRKYANDETREYLLRDMFIEVIGAVVYGLYQGGWSLTSLGHGFIGFLILFLGAYLIHLGHAPRALDLARAVQVHELDANLVRVRNELETERTTARLEGEFHQVYIEDGTFDDDGGCFFVTVQASLWNSRNVPTSVREFYLRALTESSEYRGRKVSSRPFSYFEQANALNWYQDITIPLDLCELPYNPLPEGYKRGQPQRERWLRFRLRVSDFAELLRLEHPLAPTITRLVLIAIDTEGVAHEITGEPPWITRGRVDYSPLDTTAIDNVMALDKLATLHAKGHAYFEQGKHGQQLVANQEIMDWTRAVCDVLQMWRGRVYEIEFMACADHLPFDEKYASSVAHRQRCAYLHPRLEKLLEYMKQVSRNS